MREAKGRSPQERIAAVDEWLKSNGSALTARRNQLQTQSTQTTTASENNRRFPRQNVIVGRTPDEQALVSLANEFSDAIAEMRAQQISPRHRVRDFDEFLKVNREVIQELRELQKRIALQHSASTPAPIAISLAGRTPEEATLAERSQTLIQETATRRAAIEQLEPRERIAAMSEEAVTRPIRNM